LPPDGVWRRQKESWSRGRQACSRKAEQTRYSWDASESPDLCRPRVPYACLSRIWSWALRRN